MPRIRRGFELRGQKEKGFLGLLLSLGYLRERGSDGEGGGSGAGRGRRKGKGSSLLFGKMKTPPSLTPT